jgi:hypothetical protein
VSKIRSSPDSEEVPINKWFAYRVDIFLSLKPCAKPLVLLVATLLLIIALGGLALYCLIVFGCPGPSSLTQGTMPMLWVLDPSWFKFQLVFGGMLVFAMMLGIVTDSVSEKFDSLRKGRSEVIEQSHTLILGWSDKLVILE